MKPMLLIAGNFLREQRWPLILLVVWVFVSAIMAIVGGFGAEDVWFFLKQQSVYGVALAAFLAASAIHNERRSRRILAVLSKGISRAEYLAGLLAGVVAAVAVYCASIAIAGALMCSRARISQEQLGWMLVLLVAASILTATVGIFFATFLTPLLATAATALALGAPVFLARAFGAHWDNTLPVYGLMQAIITAPGNSLTRDWPAAAWALADAVALWGAASVVFARRDIAVAVE